ncbi:MAG: DUF2807 domain-containing protein [Alphaproteobacteria bacterium]|nr:DUF2807 domain-containing protein [Alphaproteobacteria bacterium]MDE2042192.1 DUF2807 domain-containing protein [Alphaproteobacteria bacterium]MDE2341686.1 DUF2807 domain-containing protein [Alphaproteobacteria bacterium]
MYRAQLVLGALLAFVCSEPLAAAQQSLPVLDFDALRVIGALTVEVKKGHATALSVIGDPHDLDSVAADVADRTLIIGMKPGRWGSEAKTHGPILLRITVPRLRSAEVVGAGTLNTEALQGVDVTIIMNGPGSINATQVRADHLEIIESGPGKLVASGTAAQLNVQVNGFGSADLTQLSAKDIKIGTIGGPAIQASATRSALINANGSGTISVTGHPACTVHNEGEGIATCGG